MVLDEPGERNSLGFRSEDGRQIEYLGMSTAAPSADNSLENESVKKSANAADRDWIFDLGLNLSGRSSAGQAHDCRDLAHARAQLDDDAGQGRNGMGIVPGRNYLGHQTVLEREIVK